MLGFIEKCFFAGLAFLSTLTSVNTLRLQIVNVNGDDPVFFPLVLKQVNAVVVATISTIHAQNCVLLML